MNRSLSFLLTESIFHFLNYLKYIPKPVSDFRSVTKHHELLLNFSIFLLIAESSNADF